VIAVRPHPGPPLNEGRGHATSVIKKVSQKYIVAFSPSSSEEGAGGRSEFRVFPSPLLRRGARGEV